MFSRHIPLAPLTTFKVPAFAKLYTQVDSVEALQELVKSKEFQEEPKRLVLGGGSNMLFTTDYPGLVIHNKITGIKFQDENEQSKLVIAGAGENWHEFVLACLQQNLGGIENLSLIPGTVGASPVQNIGAYGVELKDVFVSLDAVDLTSGEIVHITKEECEFGYRESIFKHKAKDKYFITHVTFRLKKEGFHKLHMNYGAISQTLQEMEISQPTIQDVSNAVIYIRSTKLPDPKVVGNAGSFFKNPEIPEEQCEQLLSEHPLIPTYPATHVGYKKIAAGWLIEQTGWKGKSLGNATVHKMQALVLTNPGNATGAEVKKLAEEIQKSVLEKFGVRLETEVNIF